jgi:hypothetical protein
MVLQVDEIWRKFKPCEVTIVSNMKSSPSWPNTFHKQLPPCESKKAKAAYYMDFLYTKANLHADENH